jgi:hypothetical protein
MDSRTPGFSDRPSLATANFTEVLDSTKKITLGTLTQLSKE